MKNVTINWSKTLKNKTVNLMCDRRGILSLLFVVILSGCQSTIEILPDLCYNDRDKTYVCIEEPSEKPLPTIERDLFDSCDAFIGTDAWHWCIQSYLEQGRIA